MALRTGDDDLFELRKNFEIFGSVYEHLVTGYVDEIRPQPFMRAGIEAMLRELDPYTVYYDQADLANMEIQQQSSSGTVGLTIGEYAGRLTVREPELNAEAYRQGVRAGDVILEIAGTSGSSLTVQEAYGLLFGEPGSTVEVVVQRPDEVAPRVFILPRVPVDRANVSWAGYLGPDTSALVGYVKLDQFGTRSGREVRRALRDMSRGSGLKGIVLDLRDNPGGILEDAVDIVELFVPKDSPVVSLRSRSDGADTVYRTEMDPLFPDTPVVILVNGFSASASEIVAGALQDYDRAVVIGTTTFGKGLVQIVRRMPHNTALKMTIAHYVLPSGRSIHSAELNSASSRVSVPEERVFATSRGREVRSGTGVTPDVVFEKPFVSELETALRESGLFFRFADHYATTACGDISHAECTADRLDILNAFRQYLVDREFSYETLAERQLREFSQEVARAGWSSLGADLAEVHSDLDAEKQHDLDRYAEQFVDLVIQELDRRLLATTEIGVRSLRNDEWIDRARAILADSPGRNQLLGQ